MNHSWKVIPKEAVTIQKDLKNRIDLSDFDKPIRYIGGTDISFDKNSSDVYAGIVILDYQTLRKVGHIVVKVAVDFPYIPGLLSFREIPAIMHAWEKLPIKPDVVMVDGHGIAHPRRMGIATHFGLVTEAPTLGCAKKILVGTFSEPQETKGHSSPIHHKGEMVGYALRSKDKVKPVFISPGTGMSLKNSLDIAIRCLGKLKLPEPTRLAHLAVNEVRKGAVREGILGF